eukprot:SAG31_NODE_268_length_18767_cov_4.644900_2_plen_64_part_00
MSLMRARGKKNTWKDDRQAGTPLPFTLFPVHAYPFIQVNMDAAIGKTPLLMPRFISLNLDKSL